MTFQNDDITMNTLIGPGSSVKGELFTMGKMRVDGDLSGRLESTGQIIVGSHSRIMADIHALSVIICGVVKGNIIAPEGVHVFPDAIVLGDIITKKLQIDDNAIIQGQCIALSNETDFQEAKKRWIDIKAINGKMFSVHKH